MKKMITLALFLCILPSMILWPQKFLSQGEIYDFEPGDEFHIIHYYCCNELAFQLEQIEISEKFFMDGKIGYCCQRNIFDFLHTNPPVLIDTTLFLHTDTLIIEHPDSIPFGNGDEIIMDPTIYNGRITCTHYFWILNSMCIEQYSEGLGLVWRAWQMLPGEIAHTADSLIYYSKGNEKWGNSLLAKRTEHLKKHIQITPNPARDYILISKYDPDLEITAIEFIDVTGRRTQKTQHEFHNGNLYSTINLLHLKSGIYFIYLSTNKGSLSYKIIKE